METSIEKTKLLKAGFVLVAILCVYFGAKIITEIKGYNFIGGGATASNIISFDGKGEISAAPDMATLNFNIKDTEKVMKDAQAKVTAIETSVFNFLDKAGVNKKDIKTESYTSYPKYDYGIPCYGGVGLPCRADSPKIVGYEVSEYVSVKIHDLAKVGDILKGLADANISEMNGPNFSIEKEDTIKATARKMAIDEAKAKAKSLAKDLGVRLVRIVNFSEGGNGTYPMMYGQKIMSSNSMNSGNLAPELAIGENKITSNVTITYEIR